MINIKANIEFIRNFETKKTMSRAKRKLLKSLKLLKGLRRNIPPLN